MQLSYLSLKSVLQYLEPNVRIQLSMQSPLLKHCDSTRPLRIQNLYWDNECLKINGIHYMGIVRRTGILKDYPYSNTTASSKIYNHPQAFIELRIDQHPPCWQDVYHRNKKKVMDFLVKKILGGREIFVQHTYIADDIEAFQTLKQLITGSLKVATFNTCNSLETLTSIFHFSTFPLKSLELPPLGNFQHPIIQTAQLLVVPSSEYMHLISNKRAHARYSLYEFHNTFVHQWLEHGKAIGTHFSVEASMFGNVIKEKHENILMKFEARVSRRSINPPGFAMKIDNFSEIFISYEKIGMKWILNFKVQKIE